jgi:outer membrane protein TolC
MRIFRLLSLSAVLAAGIFSPPRSAAQAAPTAVDGATAGSGAVTVTAEALIAQAMESSPDILSAKNDLAQARLTFEQTLPFKGTSLSAGADGAYYAAGAAKGTSERNSVGGSLALTAPILPNLAVGGGLSVSNDLGTDTSVTGSGSLSWYPLASNQVSKNYRVAYDLAMASYAQALRDVRQSATAKIMGYMDALNAVDSAKDAQALAAISLKSAQSKEAMGQASSSSLLKAQKDKTAADRALLKAGGALEKARSALALAIGGELGGKIAAGASVNAGGIVSEDDWKAPAFSDLPKKRTVLKAEADLETAKNSVNSWSDATSAKVSNGPLSLSASVTTELKITLSGKISLDLAQLDGSDAKSKRLTIEAAQLALDQSRFDAKTEYQDAVDAAQDALLALKDSEYQHRLDSGAAEAAKIKWAAASIPETEYRSALSAEKDSAAKETAARLTLAKSRSWFVTN